MGPRDPSRHTLSSVWTHHRRGWASPVDTGDGCLALGFIMGRSKDWALKQTNSALEAMRETYWRGVLRWTAVPQVCVYPNRAKHTLRARFWALTPTLFLAAQRPCTPSPWHLLDFTVFHHPDAPKVYHGEEKAAGECPALARHPREHCTSSSCFSSSCFIQQGNRWSVRSRPIQGSPKVWVILRHSLLVFERQHSLCLCLVQTYLQDSNVLPRRHQQGNPAWSPRNNQELSAGYLNLRSISSRHLGTGLKWRRNHQVPEQIWELVASVKC